MSRVHQHINFYQFKVCVDAASCFEDYNNRFSTLSAAGGLPLGIVITSAMSADVIH